MFPELQHWASASIRQPGSSVHSLHFLEMQPQPALVRDKAQDLEFSALWRALLCFVCFIFHFPSVDWKSPQSIDQSLLLLGLDKVPLTVPPLPPISMFVFVSYIKYFLSGVEMTNRGRIFKRNSGTRLYSYKNIAIGLLHSWLLFNSLNRIILAPTRSSGSRKSLCGCVAVCVCVLLYLWILHSIFMPSLSCLSAVSAIF